MGMSGKAESKGLIFVLGGARSGKSAFAERLADRLGQRILYVATAQPLDVEMERRIRLHRERRPAHWRTLEAALHTGEAVRATASAGEVVLLDCLTLLVSNAIVAEGDDIDIERAEERVNAEIEALLRVSRGLEGPMIIVSNEVGSGGVPLYPMGRIYQDLLGWANQRIAAEARQVYWVVAGIPVDIKKLAEEEV